MKSVAIVVGFILAAIIIASVYKSTHPVVPDSNKSDDTGEIYFFDWTKTNKQIASETGMDENQIMRLRLKYSPPPSSISDAQTQVI